MHHKDDDIEPPSFIVKRYDFPSLRPGESLWFDNRIEARSMMKAFAAWAKANMRLLATEIARVDKTDTRGVGWRVWIIEPAIDTSGRAFAKWASERLDRCAERTSSHELRQDFDRWLAARGLGMRISPQEFSRFMAALGCDRRRIATGTVFVGVSLISSE